MQGQARRQSTSLKREKSEERAPSGRGRCGAEPGEAGQGQGAELGRGGWSQAGEGRGGEEGRGRGRGLEGPGRCGAEPGKGGAGRGAPEGHRNQLTETRGSSRCTESVHLTPSHQMPPGDNPASEVLRRVAQKLFQVARAPRAWADSRDPGRPRAHRRHTPAVSASPLHRPQPPRPHRAASARRRSVSRESEPGWASKRQGSHLRCQAGRGGERLSWGRGLSVVSSVSTIWILVTIIRVSKNDQS